MLFVVLILVLAACLAVSEWLERRQWARFSKELLDQLDAVGSEMDRLIDEYAQAIDESEVQANRD